MTIDNVHHGSPHRSGVGGDNFQNGSSHLSTATRFEARHGFAGACRAARGGVGGHIGAPHV
jgi:hypothetical protein